MTKPQHLLTVTQSDDRGTEYQIAHEGCTGYQVEAYGDEGDDIYSSTSFDCGLTLLLENVGLLDALGVHDWDSKIGGFATKHLEPGKYTLELWVTKHPATPNGPEEYDEGLTVEPYVEPKIEPPTNCPHGKRGACLTIKCGSDCTDRYDRMHPCVECAGVQFEEAIA